MTITRRGMLRWTACGLTVAAAASSGLLLDGATSSARAQGKLEQLRQQGFARIAIANEPPYTEVTPDGKVTGAAPEVARAVLEKLGIPEIVASISEYGAMIPGLQAGRFDLVTAGLFINPERCAAVLFSEPDLCDAKAFAVKKGNPLSLLTYEDIAESETATVGVPGGSTEERLALEAGVPRARVIVAPDGPSGIKMLQDGRIDVYTLPTLSIHDLLEKTDDPNLEMVSPVKGTPVFCAGAAFAKDAADFRDAYDAVLKEIKESGEFAEIVSEFGFPAEAVEFTSREELCGGPN